MKHHVLIAWTLAMLLCLSLISVPVIRAEELTTSPNEEGGAETPDPEAETAFDLPFLAWYESGRKALAQINEWRREQGLSELSHTLALEDRAVSDALSWTLRNTGVEEDSQVEENSQEAELYSRIGCVPENIALNWIDGFREILGDPDYRSAGLVAISDADETKPQTWTLLLSKDEAAPARGQRGDGAPLSMSVQAVPAELKLLARIRGVSATPGQSLRLYPGSSSSMNFELASVDSDSRKGFLLPRTAVEVSSSNEEILSVDKDGRLHAETPGEAELSFHFPAAPSLDWTLQLEIQPLRQLELQAYFHPQDNETVWRQLQQRYEELPELSEAFRDLLPEADLNLPEAEADTPLDTHYKAIDSLKWNPRLSGIALEFARELSLFSTESDVYPTVKLPYLEERLRRDGRSGWLYTRRSPDSALDNLEIPGWARSAAVAQLALGDEALTVVCYSEADAEDSRFSLDHVDALLTNQRDEKLEADAIRYPVLLYADESNYQLVFVDQGQEIQNLVFSDPNLQNLSQMANGSYAYPLHPYLRFVHENGEISYAEPSRRVLFYTLDKPEISGFTDSGELCLRAAGENILHLTMREWEGNSVVAEAELPISIFLTFPEAETSDPLIPSAPSPASEETQGGEEASDSAGD